MKLELYRQIEELGWRLDALCHRLIEWSFAKQRRIVDENSRYHWSM